LSTSDTHHPSQADGVERLPPTNAAAHIAYEFGDLELDAVMGRLTRRGKRVDADPKPIDLILLLVRNRDRFVPGAELMRELWPDVTVSPAALASAVRDARRAVADTGSEQAVIATRRGRGYRFVADVRETPIVSTARSASKRGSEPPRVAVMQFRDVGVETSAAPVVSRLAAALVSLLEKSSGQSALGPAPLPAIPREVGKLLDTDYLILGGATQEGDVLHVSARLVEVATGLHQWSEPYQIGGREQIADETEIAVVLASSLSSQIQYAEGQRAMRRPVDDLGVLELVRRALTLRYEAFGADSTQEAIDLLSLAVQRNPDNGLALAALGAMLGSQVGFSMVDEAEDQIAQTRALNERAALAAPEDPEVLGWRGGIHLALNEWDEAVRCLEACLERDPTLINFATRLGWARVLQGSEVERGLAEIETAMARSPRDPQAYLSYFYQSVGLAFTGRLDEATRAVRQSIARYDGFAPAWVALSVARALSGDSDRALAAMQSARTADSKLDRSRCRALVAQAVGGSESQHPFFELIDSIWNRIESSRHAA